MQQAIDLHKVAGAVQKKLDNNPTWYYTPSPGQLRFHQSNHAIRFLCPGNGWGKTAAMGHEVQAWMTHTNRWRPTPKKPIVAIWFPADYKQFEILLPKMREKCWGPLPQWRPHAHHSLIWPDGSTLYVAPQDRSWAKVQGVALDLALFDEHFPMALMTEIQQRRRGDQKTEIVIAATMTKGLTWEYKHLYRKWLDYHQGLGFTEDEAMNVQKHKTIFCWPKGGLPDNPSMSREDRAEQEEKIYSSDKEKLVRMGGGFQDWTGDPVFDGKGIDWMKKEMERIERERPTLIRAGTIHIRAPE